MKNNNLMCYKPATTVKFHEWNKKNIELIILKCLLLNFALNVGSNRRRARAKKCDKQKKWNVKKPEQMTLTNWLQKSRLGKGALKSSDNEKYEI